MEYYVILFLCNNENVAVLAIYHVPGHFQFISENDILTFHRHNFFDFSFDNPSFLEGENMKTVICIGITS